MERPGGGKPEARLRLDIAPNVEPEARLRLYVGGNVEAMLDIAPFPLHTLLTREG